MSSSPPLDALAVKALLTNSGGAAADAHVTALRTALHQFAQYDAATESAAQDSLKLQVLLQSRVLELEKAGQSPWYVSSLCRLGRLWLALGERDKAVGQYKKAVDLRPQSARAHAGLAQAYTERADYDQAIAHHQLAIRYAGDAGDDPDEPDDPDPAAAAGPLAVAAAHASLALTYEAQSDFDQATATSHVVAGLLAALPLATQQSQATVGKLYAQLGSLFEKTGDYETAVQHYRAALANLTVTKGPTHASTQEVEYLLDMVSNFVD